MIPLLMSILHITMRKSNKPYCIGSMKTIKFIFFRSEPIEIANNLWETKNGLFSATRRF